MEIQIIGEITSEMLKSVLSEIKNIPQGMNINLIISSYGGCILSTIGIIDALRGYDTTAHIMGFACSSAAILACSCNHVKASPSSLIMIHSAWSEDSGSDDEGIKRCNDRQIEIINRRCQSITADEITSGNDIWLDAEQALANGLIDEIDDKQACYQLYMRPIAAGLKSLIYNHYHYTKGIKSMDENKTLEQNFGPEIVEEAVEETAEQVDEPTSLEKIAEMIEVLSARVTGIDLAVKDLEARLKAMDEETPVSESAEGEPKPEIDEKIEKLYQAVCAPKPMLAVGPKAVTAPKVYSVSKEFRKFIK